MGKRNKAKATKPGTGAAASKKKAGNSSTRAAESSKYTVEDLLVKIDDLIERFEFEAAQKFCERALQINADHPQLLETTAAVLLELGNPDQAHEVLCRAVEISPDSGHVKYMYLGQMCPGQEAAQHYVKGLAIMEHTLQSQASAVAAAAPSGSSSNVSAEDICSGYCSLAELYLTDLCFEENAAALCTQYVTKALELCPENPEAMQLMASCRISEGNNEGAKQLIVKSVDAWLPSEEAAAGAQPAAASQGDEIPIPPYPARVAAAKILIEVSEHERAFAVLEGLLDDDDEVIQVWYLFGWAHYHCKELADARTYLIKAKELTVKHVCDDMEMIAHIDELLTELGPEPDDGEDDGDEEGMEMG